MIFRRLRLSRKQPAADPLAARIEYIRGQLLRVQGAGAEAVSIAWMLDMIEGRPERTAPMGPAPEPGADPLTGCLPVTAKTPPIGKADRRR